MYRGVAVVLSALSLHLELSPMNPNLFLVRALPLSCYEHAGMEQAEGFRNNLVIVARVLIGLNNKNLEPDSGANAEGSERDRSKSRPKLNFLTSQPQNS